MKFKNKLLGLLALFMLIGCLEESDQKSETTNAKKPTNKEMLVGGLTENLVVLQGVWQNDNDESEIITVEKNNFIWQKNNDTHSDYWVEAYSNCPNFCSTQNSSVSQYPCFILKEENTATCYAILKLDKEELVFSPIAGKPNLRTFKRQN